MAEDLSEIDDQYKTELDTLLEDYKERLSKTQDRDKEEKIFREKLKKLIEIRNKKSEKYIQKNKDKLLGLEEKKKKAEEKTEAYRAYNFNFEKTGWERFLISVKFKWFKFALHMKSFFRHVLPFRLGLFLFRVKFMINSFFGDIFFVFKGIFRRIARFVSKRFEFLRGVLSWLMDKFKQVLAYLKEKKKAWDEKRKKAKEEKEKKKAEKAAAEKAAKEGKTETKAEGDSEQTDSGEKKDEN